MISVADAKFVKMISLYTFIGINNHPERMFYITEKQMKDIIKKATKTFQRKINVEGVNE